MKSAICILLFCYMGAVGSVARADVFVRQIDADKMVAEFHARYNGKDWPGIWENASEEFKKGTVDEFTAFIGNLRNKSGNVVRSRRENTKYPKISSREIVLVTRQETVAERLTYIEHFRFSIINSRVLLVGYRVELPKTTPGN
jgi:hypothetical protein